ncbi:MAG: hypothetical protein M1510_08275 [Nitrospirae bacterium]|nr:hypothetical protein [Nitrospirota bacterium]
MRKKIFALIGTIAMLCALTLISGCGGGGGGTTGTGSSSSSSTTGGVSGSAN